MSDYRIEKIRCPVVVRTHSGETIAGEIFLQPFVRPGGENERPQDILNSDDPFFPVALSDGDTLLIAKEQVLELSTPRDEGDDAAGTLGRPIVIEVRLVSGDKHAGAIFVDMPSDRPRLLDFLNRHDERFLTLHGTERRFLINRQAIEHVRPLD
ncbi:MAG TPA: hypothetical protein VHM30_17435 [Gemmatimonadaceae bacterium]|nr:hypothetical protein [Gemmatimonadaceae bacterium]